MSLPFIAGESNGVHRLGVKRASLGVTNKDSGTSVTLMEVESFLSLDGNLPGTGSEGCL